VHKTSYKIWNGKIPNFSYLNIWGYDAYVKRILFEKLGSKSDKYKFVGYIKETIGYYFYHPIEQKLFFSKHVAFIEKKIIHVKEYLFVNKSSLYLYYSFMFD
jgi:hypothetical protein